MPLPRTDVVEGFPNELRAFGDLLQSLDEKEAKAKTRCEGWTVADVAAHVIGTLADVTSGNFDDLATPAGVERQVSERRGRSLAELVEELRAQEKAGTDILNGIDDAAWAGPAPKDLAPTMGDGVEALWYDAFVHADDIRAAVGRPSERGPGQRAAISHLAVLLEQKGWGPATLDFDGVGTITVGGGGTRVTGDPLQFTLVATGRADPSSIGLDPSVNVYG
jgi:uncharacterized protein (TIGR03083 family)